MEDKYIYYVTSSSCFGPLNHPQGFVPKNWNGVTEDRQEGRNM